MISCALILSGETDSIAEPATIKVEAAWVRAVPPVSKNSAAYMIINNHGDQEDQLLSVHSALAEAAETHTVVKKGALKSMQPVQRIAIPAHGSVALKPGGFHIMLINLKAPLRAGDQTRLLLKFQHAGDVKLTVEIRESPPE